MESADQDTPLPPVRASDSVILEASPWPAIQIFRAVRPVSPVRKASLPSKLQPTAPQFEMRPVETVVGVESVPDVTNNVDRLLQYDTLPSGPSCGNSPVPMSDVVAVFTFSNLIVPSDSLVEPAYTSVDVEPDLAGNSPGETSVSSVRSTRPDRHSMRRPLNPEGSARRNRIRPPTSMCAGGDEPLHDTPSTIETPRRRPCALSRPGDLQIEVM